MLSRVAEAIYWMNRYLERAENVARVIDVNLHLLLDLPTGTAAQWEPLIHTTGDQEAFHERFGTPTREHVVAFLTVDPGNPNAILSCLRAARDNARSVRESLSSELWEHVNTFYLMVQEAAGSGWNMDASYDLFTRIKHASHLLVGITDVTMSHGEAWHFGQLGRLLERADKTSRILDVKYFYLLPSLADVGTSVDEMQWAAVLKSASAFEMYRQRFGRLAPVHIADFLLLDHEFPRAVQYCVRHAEVSLHAISGSPIGTFDNPAEQRLGRLRAALNYADIQDIMGAGLHAFLDEFQRQLNRLDDAIFATFFASPPVLASSTDCTEV